MKKEEEELMKEMQRVHGGDLIIADFEKMKLLALERDQLLKENEELKRLLADEQAKGEEKALSLLKDKEELLNAIREEVENRIDTWDSGDKRSETYAAIQRLQELIIKHSK